MMDRVFLALIGLIYFVLAIACSLAPEKSARTVGFEMLPGSGQSEFLVVYGGLELALAILFLWPLARPQDVVASLTACLVVHGCLVLFRTISFGLYRGIATTTYALAAGEWAVFLLSAIFCGRRLGWPGGH